MTFNTFIDNWNRIHRPLLTFQAGVFLICYSFMALVGNPIAQTIPAQLVAIQATIIGFWFMSRVGENIFGGGV